MNITVTGVTPDEAQDLLDLLAGVGYDTLTFEYTQDDG